MFPIALYVPNGYLFFCRGQLKKVFLLRDEPFCLLVEREESLFLS